MGEWWARPGWVLEEGAKGLTVLASASTGDTPGATRPPPERPKCRLCRSKVEAKGLCHRCYNRLWYPKQKANRGL